MAARDGSGDAQLGVCLDEFAHRREHLGGVVNEE